MLSAHAMLWQPLNAICPLCKIPRSHGHEPHNILAPLLDMLEINSTAGLFIDGGPSYDMSDGQIALRRGFHVLAIEARPVVAQHLSRKFNESVATGQLSVLNAGLAAAKGIQTLHIIGGLGGDTSSLSLSAVGGHRGEETNITLTTLDDVVGGAACAAIKLDIQGYEIEALQGAVGLLARDAAPLVIVEVCERLRPEAHAFKMFHQLHRAGYMCYDILSNPSNRMPDGSLRHQHRCCHSANATHHINAAAGANANLTDTFCYDDAEHVCKHPGLYTDLVCFKPRSARGAAFHAGERHRGTAFAGAATSKGTGERA